MIFLLGFFFQSDRPTQYQEMHSTLNEKKKRGDGLIEFPRFLITSGFVTESTAVMSAALVLIQDPSACFKRL